MKLRLLSLAGLVAISGAFVIAGCSDDDAVNPGGAGSGGASSAGKGGKGAGGNAGHGGTAKGGEGPDEGGTGPATGGTGPDEGGSANGGSSAAGKGGSGTGGTAAGGGGASGGSAGKAGSGGSATGGSSTGGSATGGSSTGGSSTGGSATGGSSTGGSSTGGSSTGGTGTGGTATGGSAPAGGSGGASGGSGPSGGSGGTSAGGTGPTGGSGGTGGSCTASYTGTSLGGAGGGTGTPVLVYNFDSSASVPSGWSAGPGYQTTDLVNPAPPPATTATTAYSSAEKNQCAGSLKGTFPFTSYTLFSSGSGEIGVLQYTAPTTLDWTGKTKLHAWAKIDAASGVNHINFPQFFINTSDFGHYISGQAANWYDGAWHEYVVPLPATGWDKTAVKTFGLQINLKGTAPSGGPATPPTTIVYVDDIWVE